MTLYFILVTALLVSAIIKRFTREGGLLSKLAEFVADLSFIALCIFTLVIWLGVI